MAKGRGREGMTGIGTRWAFRCVALHLLAALFSLRALLPLGFMPDLDAASAGRFEIALCTAYGPSTLTVDAAGQPSRDDPAGTDRTEGRDCPFFVALSKSLTLPKWEPIIWPAGPAPVPVAERALAPICAPTAGAPLGPRAPPI